MPLTHFDAEGKARMVDVTEKKETVREATATGKIKVSRDVYDRLKPERSEKAMCFLWRPQPGSWV